MGNDKMEGINSRRVIRILFALSLPLGLIVSSVTRIFFENLSDYWSGYWAGFSVVLMLLGIAYIGWCWGKGRNPYRFD